MTYEEALELLPVTYAQALELRRLGHDEQQIAAELALEPAAVQATLRLAEAKLTRLLTQPHDAAGQLTSDEELQRIRVRELVPHNAPITLVNYDPEWPRLFAQEADRIRAVLGETALQIEHVGSTSVPGLTAKPIVDMLLVVPDSAHEPSYLPALELTGYLLWVRDPDWCEHRLFKSSGNTINLHVFTAGAAEIDRMLRFRDWLRATPADRDHYAAVKRELARRTWRHVQHYAQAKTPVIQEIMERAEQRRPWL